MPEDIIDFKLILHRLWNKISSSKLSFSASDIN